MANVSISAKRDVTSSSTEDQAEAAAEEAEADDEEVAKDDGSAPGLNKASTGGSSNAAADDDDADDDEGEEEEEGGKMETKKAAEAPTFGEPQNEDENLIEENALGQGQSAFQKQGYMLAHGEDNEDEDAEDEDMSQNPYDNSNTSVNQHHYKEGMERRARQPEAAQTKPRATKKSGRGGLVSTLGSARETFNSDQRSGTCEATISVSISAPKMLTLELAEQVAQKSIVREVEGIGNSFVVENGAGGVDGMCVQTDGLNFSAVWGLDDRIDVSRIRANDVYAVLQTYGVEAARSTLIAEVRSVFSAYGIGVDARHLNLIADWMTFTVRVDWHSTCGKRSKALKFYIAGLRSLH